MQYILSQQEYDALQSKQTYDIQLSKDKLQELCTKIADEMPIQFWSNEYKTPWGCKLTAEAKYPDGEWYCDECPVKSICPARKSYSK